MSNEVNLLAEKIVAVLSEIYDPEIPVSIYELGLIYDVQISKNFDVKLLISCEFDNTTGLNDVSVVAYPKKAKK